MIESISIIIASLTAIYSIDQWRREHRGKRQAELAEEALSLFYEAQDAIRHIRTPFAYGGEGSSRKSGNKESPEEKQAFDKAYVVFERFGSHNELFNKLHAIRYRFMAEFGVDAAKPFDVLQRIANEIKVSARMLARLWARQNRSFRNEQSEQKYFNQIQKLEAIFWDGLEEDDPINPKLKECIAEVEKTCRNILTAKGTLFSFLNHPFPRIFKKKKSNQ